MQQAPPPNCESWVYVSRYQCITSLLLVFISLSASTPLSNVDSSGWQVPKLRIRNHYHPPSVRLTRRTQAGRRLSPQLVHLASDTRPCTCAYTFMATCILILTMHGPYGHACLCLTMHGPYGHACLCRSMPGPYGHAYLCRSMHGPYGLCIPM
jgi:hypothetical protein